MTNETNNTTQMSETKAVWLMAVKEAVAARAAIFARGTWTREEMLAANARIQDATNNFNRTP